MKRLLVPVVIVAVLGPIEALAHRHKPDAPTTSLRDAWNAHDVPRMMELLTPDADISYPYRSFVVGREDIAKLLAAEHESRMLHSRLELVGEPRFRGGGCSCLIVDYDATLSSIKDQADQRLVISTVVVQTKLARTEKEDAEWSIASLRLIPADHVPTRR